MMYHNLSDSERDALNVAKTKGGFFNPEQKQAISDACREYYTEVAEIKERVASSVDAIAQAFSENDTEALKEYVMELDEKELIVVCEQFEGQQREELAMIFKAEATAIFES